MNGFSNLNFKIFVTYFRRTAGGLGSFTKFLFTQFFCKYVLMFTCLSHLVILYSEFNFHIYRFHSTSSDVVLFNLQRAVWISCSTTLGFYEASTTHSEFYALQCSEIGTVSLWQFARRFVRASALSSGRQIRSSPVTSSLPSSLGGLNLIWYERPDGG